MANTVTRINHLSPACQRLMSERFGGSRISIPARESGTAWQRLVDAIGEDFARSVVRWAGGEVYAVPKARETTIQESIEQLLADGLSVKEISALTFPIRISERHIRRINAARTAAKG